MTTETRSLDLKNFAKEAFHALGGLSQELGEEGLEVLLPEPAPPYFQGRDILRLRFCAQPGLLSTSEIQQETFALGTSAFENLAALLSEKGSLAKAYLNPSSFKTGNLEEKFLKKIHWVHAKPSLKNQFPEETATAVFCFKTSFLTDDKTERLDEVAVNLTTHSSGERLLEDRKNIFAEKEPAYSEIPLFQVPPPEAAYQKASEILRVKISPEVKKTKNLQEKFLRRDFASLEEYYAGLEAELEEKEKRLQAGDPSFEKIKDRKKALSLDRIKKTLDIQEKYRLDVEINFVNLLILYQPWVRMIWNVKTRRGEMERIFFWDPVLKDFHPVFCDRCRQNCETFFAEGTELLCHQCSEKV